MENYKIHIPEIKDLKEFIHKDQIYNFINTIEKIIIDKNYRIIFDNSITNPNGYIINAKIERLSDDMIEIRINPNSKCSIEYLLIHEITHAIETDNIKKLIIDYVKKHSSFNETLENLKQIYGNHDISSEVVADISGQLFGNPEFINNLSMEQPNMFKKIYNSIISLANKITRNSYETLFIKELKVKWEYAYRTQNNNISKSAYSIQQDSNGNKYVNVDTDQDIFEGINPKDYNKIAKMYINDYLRGETRLSNEDKTIIDGKSANKYTNPGKKQPNFIEKMKLTPELRNVLKIAQKSGVGIPTKDTSKYGKWEYYDFNFKIGNQSFNGKVNIGIDENGQKHFYEVNNIKKPVVYRMFHRIGLLVFMTILYHKITIKSTCLLNILCKILKSICKKGNNMYYIKNHNLNKIIHFFLFLLT